MSSYQFTPISTIDQVHPFVTWNDAFTDNEIDLIKAYCNTLPKQFGEVGTSSGTGQDDSVRISNIAWFNLNSDTSSVYDRLAYVARSVNSKFFNFDLYGFVEDFQYTEYTGTDYGHYTWHIDMSNNSPSPRKLSLVLQLTDPSEYEGGALEVQVGPEKQVVDKKKGLITVFPAWALHRVSPVTSGIRHTLVAWIAGPSFK